MCIRDSYYAAESINGYLIAQSASTGNLELVTPSGTYWKTQTLVTQSTKAGEASSWVLYDMALDYSGKYAKALDPYESTNGTDTPVSYTHLDVYKRQRSRGPS